jgi:hypothetical protein
MAIVNQHSAFGRLYSAYASAAFCLMAVFGFFHSGIQAAAAERDGRWAILISGASGDQELQKTYLKEISDLHSVLVDFLKFPRSQISVLFDDPSKNPELIQRKATREELQTLCKELSTQVQPNDLMLVFIEGHGNYDGQAYKLNLVGPDPTGEELALMLYSIPAQRFIVINTTNCSGGSIPALSKKGKIVVTSTKSGTEKNQPHAAQFFIDAFKNNAADSDKNGRVSMMEAFSYARQKVEEYYQNEGSMQTEHAVLEDNGDGQAQSLLTPENGEGLLARTVFLDSGVSDAKRAGWTPEQQKLAREAQEIEGQIEVLKYAKGEMPEADYERMLEELLLKLAQINAKLPE